MTILVRQFYKFSLAGVSISCQTGNLYLLANSLLDTLIGYGKSNGSPTEKNCYADIEAAYRYLLEVRRIPPEQIVLYGRSLGSGPSCYLAAKTAREGRSVGGVILQSPLLSAYRLIFALRWWVIDSPTLVMLHKYGVLFS